VKSARLLPYVGTINAARDMDVLRAALGDKQLTYFGASYGTYLGAFYADQFPKNVRALVLDGAIDPKLSAEQVNLEQAKGFERALRAFATDCVRSSGCTLGNNTDAVLDKVSELLARADKTPFNNGLGDGRVVNEPMAATGIAAALYQKEAWPTLRLALSRAADSNDGTLLLKLADLLTERKEDGTYSNLMESNMAVNCVDKPFPADPRTYASDAAVAKKAAPRFGPFIVWGSIPCAYWPKAACPRRCRRQADPRGRHHPRPGHPLQLGQGPGRRAPVRRSAQPRRRRPHRLPRGQPLHRSVR
jgi:pimeloyl-ACP methyl ester carboxylesterase